MDETHISAHNELPVDGERSSSGRTRMFEELLPPMSEMEIRIGASQTRLRHKMARKDGLRQHNRNERKTGRKINKTMYVGRGRPIYIPKMDPEAKHYMELNAKRRRLAASQASKEPVDHQSADALYHELEHTWDFKEQ